MAALDGAVGRRVSTGRLGERLGGMGLRPGQDRSAAWFQLATGVLACVGGIYVKVTTTWPQVCARARASCAAVVRRCLEH